MNTAKIDRLIARRERLTNRRDGLTDSKVIARIDAQLSQVPPGQDNRIDLLLGRTCAVLPNYGPQSAPSDYRIANRPDNPNWHGVKEWFDEVAQLSAANERWSTDDQRQAWKASGAADAVRLAAAKQDEYLTSIADQHEDMLDFMRICGDLAL